MVPEKPVEQLVEFSIDLVDPGYRELLDDPDSPQYVDLAHHLQDQVCSLTPPGVFAPELEQVTSQPALQEVHDK